MGRVQATLRERLSIFLALLVLSGTIALPAAAGPQDKLEDIEDRQEKVREKIEETEARGDDLTTAISGLDSERAVLEDRLAQLNGEVAELDERIGTVRDDLTEAQQELTALSDRRLRGPSGRGLQVRPHCGNGRAACVAIVLGPRRPLRLL
jgi:septal ring factor EnvC (AmiA/AmiB activator)